MKKSSPPLTPQESPWSSPATAISVTKQKGYPIPSSPHPLPQQQPPKKRLLSVSTFNFQLSTFNFQHFSPISHLPTMRFLHYCLILLVLSVTWTAWQWLRPYDPTNSSPWQVDAVTVKRDHQFAWFEVEIRRTDKTSLTHPPLARLISDQKKILTAADARLSRDGSQAQIRFWLDWNDVAHGWQLDVENHPLRLKEPANISLAPTQQRRYRHYHW
jgi:hypothetical protein